MANWTDKKLSKEEEILFKELDGHPQNQWKILKNCIDHNLYSWFLEKLKSFCGLNDIRFFDMNAAISKKELHEKWLYVDRAHFTDEGNKVAAEILRNEVIAR